MRLVIPVFPGFMPLDAIGPHDVLRFLPDAEPIFVAEERGPVRAAGGLGLYADATFDDIDACDVVAVPGGRGARAYDERKPLIDWLTRVHPTTTWMTSVCTGSLLLGAAGILNGLDATSHWNAVEELESHGAHYTPERVVRRGKVVTSAGVSSGIDMALTLTGLIAGEEFAKSVQLWIEYDPQPPHDTGSVAKAGPELTERTRGLMAGSLRR
jgi:transcriptional regulator GlxA family with amidase domain